MTVANLAEHLESRLVASKVDLMDSPLVVLSVHHLVETLVARKVFEMAEEKV